MAVSCFKMSIAAVRSGSLFAHANYTGRVETEPEVLRAWAVFALRGEKLLKYLNDWGSWQVTNFDASLLVTPTSGANNAPDMGHPALLLVWTGLNTSFD
jgi:hypothetical protein